MRRLAPSALALSVLLLRGAYQEPPVAGAAHTAIAAHAGK
jgi:hypothetical protein